MGAECPQCDAKTRAVGSHRGHSAPTVAWDSRGQERLLAAEYGVEEPRAEEGEDLECDDVADVEHWVQVYSELADLTRGLLESGSARSDGQLRLLMLQAQVRELHLTYWVNRLNRLRSECG